PSRPSWRPERRSRRNSPSSRTGCHGSRSSGESDVPDRVYEIVEGDLPLRARGHVPDRRSACLELPFPEQDRETGADRVRVVQVLRGAPTDEIDVGPEPGGPEGREDLDCLLPRGVSDRDDVRVEG